MVHYNLIIMLFLYVILLLQLNLLINHFLPIQYDNLLLMHDLHIIIILIINMPLKMLYIHVLYIMHLKMVMKYSILIQLLHKLNQDHLIFCLLPSLFPLFWVLQFYVQLLTFLFIMNLISYLFYYQSMDQLSL